MTTPARPCRIGVDVGGTFTDFVLVDDASGRVLTGKRLTTPDDPGRAILEGIARILAEAGAAIGDVRQVVHGTTLVTNTVIERKGARIGLITTRGFRDSLEMGREMRYDLYDLFLDKPEPLVPRPRRHAVTQRHDARGRELVALVESEVRDAARALRADAVEAVAVCLLHSYLDPTHERRIGAILAEELPGVPVTLSSDVAPEIREYERANTACVNAYVLPLMDRYLASLEAELRRRGLGGPLHLMLSAGGIASVGYARANPVQLIESGPAAGATAAMHYGRIAGVSDMISFDMGGTTAKMCLIEKGEAEHASTFEAARVRRFRKGSGLPLKVPVIDLIEIGAGGGSIAHVNAMGLLNVGPESAGSVPGPVCYGRGGTRPTVTDADLLLGYLSPEYFLGGEMALDLAAVEGAMQEHLGQELGMTALEVAAGIHSIVNENMAAATRMYVAEKGRDPRRYAMLAFGGAGPVHAYGLAKLLKLSRVIVPQGAGVASALGFLVAAPAIDLVRSGVQRLTAVEWDGVAQKFAQMEAEARAMLLDAGAAPGDVQFRRSADMRYAGQGFDISVPIPASADAESVEAAFRETYFGLFDRRITGVAMEVLSWRLHATASRPAVPEGFTPPEGQGAALKGHRNVWFAQTGLAPCAVYDRYRLPAGQRIAGPAVVEERESTVVIGPDAHITRDIHGNLLIDITYPEETTP
ncbi:hydantoinase/oxoprolinase family protein [Falsiroseomonas sp.]|uniref:hydantoinase/oxoprolinase family protein n=1 Tax=Falsiroseomonas sp. TaxID=2870721 RepID=UPI002722611C|nr:hydantoinase/oxoprolinase family protein [Falsiroseomonas sp.]MDO9500682.1 hydantoinase/oxoprolinase family protein [Falsiroseomonas sp.]